VASDEGFVNLGGFAVPCTLGFLHIRHDGDQFEILIFTFQFLKLIQERGVFWAMI